MFVWLTDGPSRSISLRFPIDLLALRVVVDFPMVLLSNLFSSSNFFLSSLNASASRLNLSCSDKSFLLSLSILSSRTLLLSSLFLVFCGVGENGGGSGGLTILTLFWFTSNPSSVALETPSLLPDESVLVSPTELLAELSYPDDSLGKSSRPAPFFTIRSNCLLDLRWKTASPNSMFLKLAPLHSRI